MSLNKGNPKFPATFPVEATEPVLRNNKPFPTDRTLPNYKQKYTGQNKLKILNLKKNNKLTNC